MNVNGAMSDLVEASGVIAAMSMDKRVGGQLLTWAEECSRCIQAGGIVFFAGNGGSFADAQHLAAELTGKMRERRRPLAGLALGSNGCSLTAIGNDFGFGDCFVREYEAFAGIRGVVIALTTSGNSTNILRLVDAAKSRGAPVYGLTGGTGGQLSERCQTITVPSAKTERIQEAHIILGHILCRLIEDMLVADGFITWEA